MFAIVRTGGKQYRVAAGDKITVEKLAGSVGDTVELGDVLLSGEGGDVKAGDIVVSAEIVAQGKGEKVIVFKKRRRHNYRRRNGHRQLLTLLKIVSIGGAKAKPAKAEAEAGEAKPAKKTPAKKDAAA
jgi:large subunit ribosomal protein L21